MKRIFLMFIIFAAAAPAFAQERNVDNSAGNCINSQLSLTNNSTEITVNGGPLSASHDKQYVYCHKKRHNRHSMATTFSDLQTKDPNASIPVLVSIRKNLTPQPESYKLTVNSPQDRIMVCPDSMSTLPANITVEKQSEFTGNYPESKYKEVSRRVYKKTARKMRHAECKEKNVARITGLTVEVPEQ